MRNKHFNRAASFLIAAAMVFSVMVFMPEDVSAASGKPSKVNVTKVVGMNQIITIKWKKTGGAKKYQIYLKAGNKRWKKVATVKANGKAKQSYKVKRLKWNTKYKIKLRAVNGKKRGSWSDIWAGKTVKKTTLQKLISKNAKLRRNLRKLEKQYSYSYEKTKISAKGNTFIITRTLIGPENNYTGHIKEVKGYYDKDLQSASFKKARKADIRKMEESTGIFGIKLRYKYYDSAGNFITSCTYK